MIFISGVHGVGKSYFCNKMKNQLGIETFSASKLISERKHTNFQTNKLIPDIDENQQYLLIAVQELNSINRNYLLDGHMCLLNERCEITRIPEDTFIALQPQAIILLIDEPEIIAERRKSRDGVDHNINQIKEFQNEEIVYAKETSSKLGIPLKISEGTNDKSLRDFLLLHWEGFKSGR